MRKEIEIHGDNDSLLSVELKDILRCIVNGEQYNWKILWLEATGNLEREDMPDFESKINNSVSGYQVTWENLVKLADHFNQVIEIVLLGDKDVNKLKRYESDNEMIVNCIFYVELHDSSYWTINASNMESIENMESSLRGVKVIN